MASQREQHGNENDGRGMNGPLAVSIFIGLAVLAAVALGLLAT